MMVGFKEWQVVCDALGSGRQVVLFRKGGIHEGREGFSFAHESFILFPTYFHSQLEQVVEGDLVVRDEWREGELVELRYRADARFATTLRDWEKVAALEPFHIYREEVLRERFEWEGKGMPGGSIHVALVRVMRLSRPIELKYERRYGGCRSWLDFSGVVDKADEEVVPVLDEGMFAAAEGEVRRILGME